MKSLTLLLAVLLVISCASIGAQEVEFNYNGRIKALGKAYSGPGYFKFALVNKDGDGTYWANDGGSSAAEPTTAVPCEVKDGFFSVNIGDTVTTNMASLDASLFNTKAKIMLRVWFSNDAVSFERLKPDREVVNPALLGTRAHKETLLYVDPVNGDDSYTGLKIGRAKKTIQSAWDAVPPLLETTATIRLLNGQYLQETHLKGKTIIKQGCIRIIGNEVDPTTVHLTGSSSGGMGLENGFLVTGIKGLQIKGILFTNYNNAGMDICSASEIEMNNCRISSCRKGIRIYERSVLAVHNSEFSGPGRSTAWANGVESRTFCAVTIDNCKIYGYSLGATTHQCNLQFTGTNEISDCSTGVLITVQSTADFSPTGAKISNCSTGIECSLLSSASYPDLNQYSGNGNNFSKDTSSIVVP